MDSCKRRRRTRRTSRRLGLPSLAHRLTPHRKLPVPRLPAAVREAEKVEGFRFPVATPSSVPTSIPAKFDEPRFVGMQRQAEPRETLAQFGEEAFRFPSMLESHDEIIRKTDDDHIAARLRPTPSLDPEVEDVVQVDVGEQRTNAAALDRPLWLSKTSYAFSRLRLWMFSDSLVSWRPSSSRCSTLFDSCSDHGFRCTWKSSRSDTS